MSTKYDAFMADYKAICEKHGLRIYSEANELLYVEGFLSYNAEWDTYVLFNFTEDRS